MMEDYYMMKPVVPENSKDNNSQTLELGNKEVIIFDFMKLKSGQHEQFRKSLLATVQPLHHIVVSEYSGLRRTEKGSNHCGKLLMDLWQSIQSS